MSRLAIAAALAGAVGAAAWLAKSSEPVAAAAAVPVGAGAPPPVAQPVNTTTSSTDAANSTSSPSLVLRGAQGSASSKVLVTGGYLILEPAFTGLVLALDARFRATLLQLNPAQAKQLRLRPAAGPHSAPVVLFAPQRAARPAHYELSWDELSADAEGKTAGGWKLRATESGQEKNKFVEQTIVYCLLFLQSVAASPAEFRDRIGAGWVLYLEGDYQFYSSTPPARAEGSVVPPVVPDGSKTGLGSSAALVSSMVAAIFKHFGALEAPVPAAAAASPAATFRALPLSSRLALAHNLAQLIHCSAQGKVGSGFDVATAFHGSQTYRRFTPAVISDLLALASAGATAEPTVTAASIPRALLLRQIYDQDPVRGWNYSVTPFRLPPGFVVVLGDVAGGASTPTMVKKVLEWRRNNPQSSDALWSQLYATNQRVAALFAETTTYASSHELEYKSCRLILAQQSPSTWEQHPAASLPAGKLFMNLRKEFLEVRRLLREMGSAAGVAIEPEAQQLLCDDSMQSRGVVLAGVPGAGGDDAIFALLLDRESIQALDARWSTFRFPNNPHRKVRRLHVNEEKDTIRTEWINKDVTPFNLARSGPDNAKL